MRLRVSSLTVGLPRKARDTEGTVAEAAELWATVDRPNVMVKIPATAEGLPAIRRTLAAGINVNVTLIFGLQRYAEVVDAFEGGLEDAKAWVAGGTEAHPRVISSATENSSLETVEKLYSLGATKVTITRAGASSSRRSWR